MDRRIAATIGIIEDDFSVRDSLAALLEANGYAVLAFNGGAEFFKNELPVSCACLIADVGLSRESGFEILARLRRQGSSIPVILISGIATTAMRGRARAAHVELLEKPTPASVLLAKISEVLGTQ